MVILKKGAYFISILVTLLLINSIFAGSAEEEGGTPEGVYDDPGTANKALEKGNPAQIGDTKAQGSGAEFNSDKSISSDSGVNINDNDYTSADHVKCTSADSCSGNGAGYVDNNNGQTEVDNFRGLNRGDVYTTIDYAGLYKDSTHTAVDAHNIKIGKNYFSAQTGSTISQKGSSVSSDVSGYETDGKTIKVDSAKAIAIDNTIFTDIGNSSFTLDTNDKLTNADITSTINNNTFDLKDTEIVLDSGEAFSADINKSEIIIETEDAIVVKKDDEVVETLTNIIDPARKILNVSDAVEPLGFESGNITSKQVGESWVEIDSVLGVVAVHLAPTSRYISYTNNSAMQPFSLYAVPFHSYDFYLKKQANQTMPIINECYHCGIVDFTKNTVVLHGYIDYERLGTNGKFVKIAQGRADNSAITLALDKSMDQITDVYM